MACGLKVGTLSSELRGSNMKLAENGECVHAIMDALDRFAPDVLLTAGWSLNDDSDLAVLEKRLKASGWDGLLFVEVRYYNGNVSKSLEYGEVLSDHCLFAWTRKDGMKRMGRQYFVSSAQAHASLDTRVSAFVENLPERVIEFRGHRFGALICGEISVTTKRDGVNLLTLVPEIASWLQSLDVLVNATHDSMGGRSSLKEKRRWLSRTGKVYVSASNWNHFHQLMNGCVQRQKRTASTMHTTYKDGKELVQKRFSKGSRAYEYREVRI